jgi:hypothetical protein
MFLIIDSKNKVSGTNMNFKIALRPGLENVKGVYLAFSNVPIAADNTESYYMVSIKELGIHVRSSDTADGTGTFMVPIKSGPGYRSIGSVNSDFTGRADAGNVTLNQLTVRIHSSDGTTLADDGNTLLVIGVE